MNYQYQIPGQQGDPAAFVADTTLILGTYVKPLDARTLISVDYSQLIPAVALDSYSFRVKPGGEPQLWISEPELGLDANSLAFFIDGGIGGRAYTVTINATLASGEVRSDVLTVQVLGDDCGSCAPIAPPPPTGGIVSGDGLVIVNTAPRFFVSGTPPVNANVLDRWYDTATGVIWDYVSNGATSLWVPAGGGGGGGGGVNILNITPILPDGSTTIFTLTAVIGVPVTIVGSNTLFVSVDGVWQDATTQYYATGNRISFAQAPAADANVFMLWFAPASAT